MPPTPVGCLPYPTDWPTECFTGLRQLYAEGRLFDDLAATHHHLWTIQGFFAGKFLGTPDPDHDSDDAAAPLRPIGDCPCPEDCRNAMLALSVEAEGIKAACQAHQGVLSDVLKSALAEVVRQGLPRVLEIINRYLDQIDL